MKNDFFNNLYLMVGPGQRKCWHFWNIFLVDKKKSKLSGKKKNSPQNI